jgi:thioredoxin-dependent peroxiredoxin
METLSNFPTVSLVENGKATSRNLKEILESSPKTLLYFYPKDNTPGCTLEGQDFSRLLRDFKAKGIQVIGVSKDSDTSHLHFQQSCSISLPLISDTGELCDIFSVMGEKNMY